MAKTSKFDIAADYVRERLHYDPETGDLRWKERPLVDFVDERSWRSCNAQRAGELARCVSNNYLRVTLADYEYGVHVLAYLIMTGEWPALMVDHANGDSLDNRWINLRPATNSQNQANRKLDVRNKSGLKGVMWRKDKKRWWARGFANRKFVHLGYYKEQQDAAKAYAEWAVEAFGEYARI